MVDLLERSSVLNELSDVLAATAGGGRVVLVAGEAGIGKSSLVKRFTERHSSDVRVLLGACDPLLTPRALGPLHHALTNIGSARLVRGDPDGRADLERAFEVAVASRLDDHAARALVNLASTGMELRDYRHAAGISTGRSRSPCSMTTPATPSTCWGCALACAWTRGTGSARNGTRGPHWSSWNNGGRDPGRWMLWWCSVCCRHAGTTRTPTARWTRPRRLPCPRVNCSG